MAPPTVTSIINSASITPVDQKLYEQATLDIEDPIYRGKSWKEVDADNFRREQEALAKMGVIMKDDHMRGYEYDPPMREGAVQAIDQGQDNEPEKTTATVMPRPWEMKFSWDAFQPKCTSKNWTHTDCLFEVKKGVAYITMNRVAANNALNDSLSAGLFDAVHECRGRTDIRVVVLKANGKMFCAGGDPKSFQDAAAMSDADNKRGALEFAGFLYTFQTLPQFTVCLAQGSAMGGGVGLVSICDMCIAVKAAHFTLSEVKLGVIPATISPYVVGKIGVSNAKRLFCTAENCNADLAKSMGLVTDVVDSADAFPAKVKEICDKITMCAPAAVASAKKLVMNVANQPVSQELINYTSDELSRVKKTEEAKDGMKAVQNRTKPAWATAAIEPSL